MCNGKKDSKVVRQKGGRMVEVGGLYLCCSHPGRSDESNIRLLTYSPSIPFYSHPSKRGIIANLHNKRRRRRRRRRRRGTEHLGKNLEGIRTISMSTWQLDA